MERIEIILLIILYFHQTLDIVGVKGYVDRPKLVSPDTIGWSIFTVLMIMYFLQVPFIKVVMIVVFGLVLYGLYNFHWKLFWFGASEKKIKGYNAYFKDTHRILPQSETRLVPDTYHIVHSLLYLFTFSIMTINILL